MMIILLISPQHVLMDSIYQKYIVNMSYQLKVIKLSETVMSSKSMK